MKMYDESIVASGHTLVSEAAAEILRNGGNAFDAVVAAGFASAVVEPALTSLGGGGLMIGHDQKTGQNVYFDFFVNTPGIGRENDSLKPDFFAVTVDFSGSSQDFNIGSASVAVPGTLKGLLHIHKKLGWMDLRDVLHPAKKYAARHILNTQQGHFLKLLYPIMTLDQKGRAIYQPDGNFLQPGDEVRNRNIQDFIDRLIFEGDDCFYRGDIAAQIEQDMLERGGLLTAKDLAAYQVIERKPLGITYKGYEFLTASEPSMGGTLIALSLLLRQRHGLSEAPVWGSAKQLETTVDTMQEVERLRLSGITNPQSLEKFMSQENIMSMAKSGVAGPPQFNRGTTHVSVADSEGNCASMTCSNGEGSGYFASTTGVMLNNMMGEDDLHPEGFHSSPPGERVFSMMSPSLLIKDGLVKLVIGSGGSKRIRTAISQVLTQVVDYGRTLQDAVDAPRMYLDGECLQIEPGFNSAAIEDIGNKFIVNLWAEKDVYFGGVHAVIPGKEGAGDPRRGGTVVHVPV